MGFYFLSFEITTVIRIDVYILTPILVVFRNILADRNLVELNPVEILNLLLKWEMVVSVTMQRVVAEVDVKPFLDPCVDPEELHKNLVTLDVVDYIHVNELRDEWRQSQLNIESEALEFLNGRDSFARHGRLFIGKTLLVISSGDAYLNVCEVFVKNLNVLVGGDEVTLRYDEILNPVLLKNLEGFIGYLVDSLGGLETVGHSTESDYLAASCEFL